MLHVMIDAYRSIQSKLDDMKFVYETINKITNNLDLRPIMPPMVTPYYYGTEPKDSGVSAFVLLEGGHFTIHTFSYRECFFIDLLYDGFFDSGKFQEIIEHELPSSTIKVHSFDRRFNSEIPVNFQENQRDDFGPHLLGRVKTDKTINMDSLFDLFESFPYDIDMVPIMRPYLMKSSKTNPKYLSGMTLIAQSHIAIHYSYLENLLYIDMFSCQFTDFTRFKNSLNSYFGVDIPFELITRGSKYHYAKTDLEERRYRYNSWQENIK